jgi:hypothetical protein
MSGIPAHVQLARLSYAIESGMVYLRGGDQTAALRQLSEAQRLADNLSRELRPL